MHGPSENSPSLVGRVFGNQFRLESLLGRGGMGEVYLAEQLELGRRVVLKLLLHSELWSTPELEERFRREARILAQLNHPNIVQLYSFGRSDDGISYLAMEYIEGRTLTSLIDERGPLSEPLVLTILDQVCSALVEAHQHGIVHRDLKPDNVMMMERYGQPAFVKVLDFGIAKLTHANELRLTKRGAILGTPQYMSPEQLREEAIDVRADIYALGIVAYELLTGKVPFAGGSTMELMLRVISEEPLPPRRTTYGGQISAAMESLIVRCLAKDPNQRFQTATELRDALAAIPRPSTTAEVPVLASEARSFETLAASPSLSIDDELDGTPRTRVRHRRARSFGIVLAVLACLAAIIGVVAWPFSSELAPAVMQSAGGEASGLAVREWVQGMPFPEGTEYDAFEPSYVDAHVAAARADVLAFYRQHLRDKWGELQDHGDDLVLTNAQAPIEEVTVMSDERGSRLFIKRRTAE